MIYKSFKNKKLSALGLGAMRLPVVEGDISKIDVAAAESMVDYAMENGINYFDTAWGYHEGNSESVLGKLLAKYPRESYYLASKFPGYDLQNMDKVQEIFETQLERCGVEYFDFYMYHNVCELNIDAYMDKKYGIFEYLTEQRQRGRIKHLGFSSHGSIEVLKRFLEAYGESMEFCQLQINYLDWKYQNAEAKVQLMREHGIPVWVMEPLRGGKLASLKEGEKLRGMRPNESIAAWAFRFLQSIPEVTVVLSGMSNMDQLRENIDIFKTDAPVNGEEKRVLLDIASRIVGGVPCTGCRYCLSKCPRSLDIPLLISLYNEHVFTDKGFYAPMTLAAMSRNEQPSCCVACRSCETVCPQQIKISDVMRDFDKMLEKQEE